MVSVQFIDIIELLGLTKSNVKRGPNSSILSFCQSNPARHKWLALFIWEDRRQS